MSVSSVLVPIAQALNITIPCAWAGTKCSGNFVNVGNYLSYNPPGPESVLKVYDQINSGETGRFLTEDARQPGASGLMRMIDWLFGLGEYSEFWKEKKITDLSKRSIPDLQPNQDDTSLENDCDPLSSNEVICILAATGLRVNQYVINNTFFCPFIDPVYYKVHISLKSPDFNTVVSKMKACLEKWIPECKVNCWSCINVPRFESTGSKTSNYQFTSHLLDYQERVWNITIQAPKNILSWQKRRIDMLMGGNILDCEKQIEMDKVCHGILIVAGGTALVAGALLGSGYLLNRFGAALWDKMKKIAYLSDDSIQAPQEQNEIILEDLEENPNESGSEVPLLLPSIESDIND